MFRKGKKRHSSSSSQSSEISTKSKAYPMMFPAVGIGLSDITRMYPVWKVQHAFCLCNTQRLLLRAGDINHQSVDSSFGGLSRSSTVASLDTDSTKSLGQASNNSEPCAEFKVKYVGSIERVKPEESKALEGSLDLINYIDVAQQDGKLPFVPSDEDFIMVVSKYGIKVTTLDQYDVLHRHPLYLIVSMVCYDDGLVAGKSLLALKTKDASEDQCSLWIYQCASLEHAQSICKVLSTAFDSVLTEKTRVPTE